MMYVLIHQIPKGLSVVGKDSGMFNLSVHNIHSLESKSFLLSQIYQRTLNQNEVIFNKEKSFVYAPTNFEFLSF